MMSLAWADSETSTTVPLVLRLVTTDTTVGSLSDGQSFADRFFGIINPIYEQ